MKSKETTSKTTSKTTDLIKKTAQKLLRLLEIQAEQEVKEKDETYYLNLKTQDPGVFIGYHGETLFSFQLILSLIIYKKIGSWQKIIIDAADYRQKREAVLKKIALNAAQKAKFTGEPQILPPLNSAERRIIHLYLAKHPDVTTESQGEGFSRRLVITPRE